MIIPLILAGGSGTRLWPLSRKLLPKQLLNLTDDYSMLQNTILRLNGLESVCPPLVICNEEHRFIIAEQLRTIGIKPLAIILEPAGRNTAPAIAVGALKALELFNNGDLEKYDNVLQKTKEPVLLVLPADHQIKNISDFHKAVKIAALYSGISDFSKDFDNNVLLKDEKENNEYLVTFGIIPETPETGYGYIKKGKSLSPQSLSNAQIIEVSTIDRFVEKPDLTTADKYVESKEYFWNSGMFMFKPSLIIKELEIYEPDIVKFCKDAVKNGKDDLDFFRLEQKSFEKSKSQSIDYAVMEKTDKGIIIPLSAAWNDLGSWDALWQTGQKDENQNVIKGDVLTSDVKNSYLYAQNRLIAAVGLDEHVVVETKDAVLVAHKSKVQNVKKLVEELKKKSRVEALSHSKVFRPWGAYETIDIEQRFQVKRITVKPGAKLSLQKHYHRAEHWTVVSGTAVITKGEEEIMLTENESTYIPPGTLHRLENPGKIPLELIEVQSGSYLGEDDIVRLDDLYGR